jgi:hypothetical protein
MFGDRHRRAARSRIVQNSYAFRQDSCLLAHLRAYSYRRFSFPPAHWLEIAVELR